MVSPPRPSSRRGHRPRQFSAVHGEPPPAPHSAGFLALAAALPRRFLNIKRSVSPAWVAVHAAFRRLLRTSLMPLWMRRCDGRDHRRAAFNTGRLSGHHLRVRGGGTSARAQQHGDRAAGGLRPVCRRATPKCARPSLTDDTFCRLPAADAAAVLRVCRRWMRDIGRIDRTHRTAVSRASRARSSPNWASKPMGVPYPGC